MSTRDCVGHVRGPLRGRKQLAHSMTIELPPVDEDAFVDVIAKTALPGTLKLKPKAKAAWIAENTPERTERRVVEHHGIPIDVW